MNRVIQHSLLVLCALLLCAPAQTVRADDAADQAAAFAKSMLRVEGYLARERFKKGLKELQKLLAAHGEKPYVRARRAEIEDLVKRFAFGAKYDPPTAGSVLAGKVERYDADTGKLKVSYTPLQRGDFQALSNGTTQFFADTMGPFSLQVWGKRMPSARSPTPWMEFSGGADPKTGEPQFWHVDFGSPDKLVGAKTVYHPARIQHIDGGKRKNVSLSHSIAAKVGSPFVVQIRVGKTTIEGAVNGKIVGRARKLDGQWGWIRFAVPGWTKLVFSGVIEPAYIQARLDKVTQRQLTEFRKNYKRIDYLPPWLFQRRPTPVVVTRPDLPVDLDKKLWSPIRNYQRHMRASAWVAARTCLDAMAAEGIPEPVVRYLSARLRFEEEDHPLGLQDVDVALEATPDFVEGLLLKGRFLGRLGRVDEALQAFQKALALHKDDPKLYEAAAVAMLNAGHPQAAQPIIEAAARNIVDSPALDLYAQIVVMAEKGPAWSHVHEYKTRNYHVFSDIGKRTCREAAMLLEEALTSYRVNFRWVSHKKNKLYPVYLFSGKWGFDQYVVDLRGIYGAPDPMTLGMYSPAIKQLVIWNQPDKQDMLDTIRHEGFHQYVDSFASDIPVWLNEGLATYHMTGVRKRGQLKFGAPHPLAHQAVSKNKWVPLAEFLFEPRAAFRKRGFASYGQAWLLAHMLMQGKTRWRTLLKDLVADLGTLPAKEALAKHFPPEVVSEMDDAARAYIKTLGKKKR